MNISLKDVLVKVLDRLKNTGTVVDGTSLATTVASAQKTNTAKVELSAGVWIVIFNAALSLSSGKQYQATIAITSDLASEQNYTGQLVRLNLSAVVNLTQETTIYGTMYHNQGSSVSINTNKMWAVRIR